MSLVEKLEQILRCTPIGSTAEYRLEQLIADVKRTALVEDEISEELIEIAAERRRQVEAEGWTPEHDDSHKDGELADAAACYAYHAGLDDKNREHAGPPVLWPWAEDWWKPKDRRRDLVRAAALIVAEIERLDRASEKAAKEATNG